MSDTNAITEEEYNRIDQTRRDISIRLYKAELPDTIRGFCSQRKDNKYLIFINSADDPELQTATFLHECLHIYHEDYSNEEVTATEIEAIRHRELTRMLEMIRTQ